MVQIFYEEYNFPLEQCLYCAYYLRNLRMQFSLFFGTRSRANVYVCLVDSNFRSFRLALLAIHTGVKMASNCSSKSTSGPLACRPKSIIENVVDKSIILDIFIIIQSTSINLSIKISKRNQLFSAFMEI